MTKEAPVESSDVTREPYLVENLDAGEACVENRREREGERAVGIALGKSRRSAMT
jgi:hypothetical protein